MVNFIVELVVKKINFIGFIGVGCIIGCLVGENFKFVFFEFGGKVFVIVWEDVDFDNVVF